MLLGVVWLRAGFVAGCIACVCVCMYACRN